MESTRAKAQRVREIVKAEMAEIARLDRGCAGRACWAGPRVERNGALEPRDISHPDYAWNVDGSERA